MGTWAVKQSYENEDGGGSMVHAPHATKLAALIELAWCRLFPTYEKVELVDHDEEMRRWGRPDFVKHKTETDKAAAAAMTGIIPRIEPGESITIHVDNP
jgi:hypothetical protein